MAFQTTEASEEVEVASGAVAAIDSSDKIIGQHALYSTILTLAVF